MFPRDLCFKIIQNRALDKRGALKIIQTYFFLLLNENIHCEPSLEPSRRDGSNEGLQRMFNEEIWKVIPKLSLLPPPYLDHFA